MQTESTESAPATSLERRAVLVSLLDERDDAALKSFGEWLVDHQPCIHLETIDLTHPSGKSHLSLPVFAYLPEEGLDAVAPKNLRALEASPRVHFFRFFRHQFVLEGEQPPALALWDSLYFEKERFRQPDYAERPFLGWAEAESFDRCAKWMLCILEHARLISELRATEALLTTGDTAARLLVGRIHLSENQSVLLGALVARLGIAKAIRQRSSSLRERRRKLDDDGQSSWSRFRDDAYVEVQSTVNRCDTATRVCAKPIGDEKLYKAFQSVTRFAKKMEKTSSNVARSIASQLRRVSSMDAPTLAVVGPFSSGKTTLLNAVLLGELPGCAFATKTTANTAIVYLISRAIPPEPERARMTYRSRIDACLFDREDPERVDPRDDKIREALFRLIGRGVVDESSLQLRLFRSDSAPPRVWTGLKVTRWLRERTALTVSPKISRVEFVATCDVDSPNFMELVREIGLPPDIRLGTEAEWKVFRGEESTAADSGFESILASLLVEEAHIKLRSPLLELTRIADTPGIGSIKEHHDWVTESYLDRADGFLVVVPGDSTAIRSTRVQKLFDLLTERLSRNGTIPPRERLGQTAFLVNIKFDVPDDKAQKIVDYYRQLIIDRFEVSTAEFSRHVRFYVARLKNDRPGDNGEKMYGYPSLAAFRRWFAEDLFAQAAYRKRFTDVCSVLHDKWSEVLQNARCQLAECQRGKEARERRAAEMLTFKDRDLPVITEKAIANLESGIGEMREEAKSIKENLRSYSRSQYVKKECDSILRQIKERYQAINEIAQGFGDPLEEWIGELDHALQSMRLRPLPVTAQLRPSDVDLDLGKKLSSAKVTSKIKDMKASWPDKWSWKGFKNLFSNVARDDIRYHWIDDLLRATNADTRAFIEPWKAYCERVCEIIRDNIDNAQSQIAAERDAMLCNPDAAIHEASREIDALQGLEAARVELIETLNSLWPQEANRKNAYE